MRGAEHGGPIWTNLGAPIGPTGLRRGLTTPSRAGRETHNPPEVRYGSDVAETCPENYRSEILVAALLLVGALLWGLFAHAPMPFAYGVIVAMTVPFGDGIRLHNRRDNETRDFPAPAAAVDRHAHGGAVGVFGGRWFALDYERTSLLVVLDDQDSHELRCRS